MNGISIDFNSVLVSIVSITATVIGIVKYMITKSEQRQTESYSRQKEITDKYFEHLEKVARKGEVRQVPEKMLTNIRAEFEKGFHFLRNYKKAVSIMGSVLRKKQLLLNF
jgi:hypothetical protein